MNPELIGKTQGQRVQRLPLRIRHENLRNRLGNPQVPNRTTEIVDLPILDAGGASSKMAPHASTTDRNSSSNSVVSNVIGSQTRAVQQIQHPA
jgi:hypothetical protein